MCGQQHSGGGGRTLRHAACGYPLTLHAPRVLPRARPAATSQLAALAEKEREVAAARQRTAGVEAELADLEQECALRQAQEKVGGAAGGGGWAREAVAQEAGAALRHRGGLTHPPPPHPPTHPKPQALKETVRDLEREIERLRLPGKQGESLLSRGRLCAARCAACCAVFSPVACLLPPTPQPTHPNSTQQLIITLNCPAADMEYFKNVLLRLYETGEAESLLPVVAQVLQFSPAEVQRCRNALRHRAGHLAAVEASECGGTWGGSAGSRRVRAFS